MSRKNFHRYTPFKNQDATVGFDNKSKPMHIGFLDNFGFQVVWDDPTNQGQIKVFVSNDEAKPESGDLPQNWSELDFGSPILIDSTNTDILININQNPYAWMAIEWIPSSGAGTITISSTQKMVGG